MSAILHLDGDNIFFDSADELRFYIMQFGDKKKEYSYTTNSHPNHTDVMYYVNAWVVDSASGTYLISPNGRRGGKSKTPATRWYYVTPDGWQSEEYASVNDARIDACKDLKWYRELQMWMISRTKKIRIGTIEMWGGRPAYYNRVCKRFYRVNATNGKITEI